MSPASNLRHNLTLVICLPMNLGPALISSHWPTSEWWVRMRTVYVRETRMCNKYMTTFSYCIPCMHIQPAMGDRVRFTLPNTYFPSIFLPQPVRQSREGSLRNFHLRFHSHFHSHSRFHNPLIQLTPLSASISTITIITTLC
jgi:hypothetical protein